jgi:putative ABC transport system permease protein
MRRVALKGLWWRRGRSLLTSLAIVLGVAMVSGTFMLTDSVSKAFDSIFSDSYAGTSVVISGREVVSDAASGVATVPQSLLAKVRADSKVDDAQGAIFNLNGTSDVTRLIGRDGKTLGAADSPKFGFGFSPAAAKFNPLSLSAGRWASGPDQVVIDKGTADDAGYHPGDRIVVAANGAKHTFTISGVARYGTVNSLGGATIAVFDLPEAQALLDKRGRLDTILVAAKSGVSANELVRELEPLVPASAQARTASDQADSDAQDTEDATNIVRYILLGFALIAVGVGAFVIFNTLSITVAQRIRELATLRTLGASRRQVRRSVLLEGLSIGVFASLTGLALGVGLAKGLNAMFDALGLELPESSLVLNARTVIVSLAVGIVVTVIASVSPARRATTIPPVAALREGATLPPRLGARRPAVPVAVFAVALAMMLAGAFGGFPVVLVLALLVLGVFALFVAVSMLANRAIRPLAGVVGAPGRRFGGVAGRLAGENTTRNVTRTATTAGALMIGLALVTVVAALASGLRSADRRSLDGAVSADYVVAAKNNFDTIPRAVGPAVAGTPGIGRTVALRQDSARAFGGDVTVNGGAPGFTDMFNLRWSHGSDATFEHMGAADAVVKKQFADDHGLRVGRRFQVTTSAGRKLDLTVAGIQDPKAIDTLDPLVGDVLMSLAGFDAGFPRPANVLVVARADGGVTPATTTALERSVVPFADVEARTKATWVHDRSTTINKLLNVLYVLLALSVIVSLFGMVNALVLSVFERTREIGMLRAIGMGRRQVRRMIRHESVITALIGAALGLAIGLLVAAILTGAMRDLGVTFTIPVASLLAFTVVAIVAGVLAAVGPARRAARLDVLQALHYE